MITPFMNIMKLTGDIITGALLQESRYSIKYVNFLTEHFSLNSNKLLYPFHASPRELFAIPLLIVLFLVLFELKTSIEQKSFILERVTIAYIMSFCVGSLLLIFSYYGFIFHIFLIFFSLYLLTPKDLLRSYTFKLLALFLSFPLLYFAYIRYSQSLAFNIYIIIIGLSVAFVFLSIPHVWIRVQFSNVVLKFRVLISSNKIPRILKKFFAYTCFFGFLYFIIGVYMYANTSKFFLKAYDFYGFEVVRRVMPFYVSLGGFLPYFVVVYLLSIYLSNKSKEYFFNANRKWLFKYGLILFLFTVLFAHGLSFFPLYYPERLVGEMAPLSFMLTCFSFLTIQWKRKFSNKQGVTVNILVLLLLLLGVIPNIIYSNYVIMNCNYNLQKDDIEKLNCLRNYSILSKGFCLPQDVITEVYCAHVIGSLTYVTKARNFLWQSLLTSEADEMLQIIKSYRISLIAVLSRDFINITKKLNEAGLNFNSLKVGPMYFLLIKEADLWRYNLTKEEVKVEFKKYYQYYPPELEKLFEIKPDLNLFKYLISNMLYNTSLLLI
ncbi:MAG: hypothetical protein QXY96_07295 [Candidatus Methanomethylicaceae archaeon]